MAEVVKTDTAGYMVDITAVEGKPPLTKEESDVIQAQLTAAMFAREDISNLKFETPYFDGNKLRLICKNDETMKWLLEVTPTLDNLWDNAEIQAVVIGPPPKLIMGSIIMPAKVYEPATLFRIVMSQNGIDTTFWRYKSRTKVVNGHQTWYVAINENSIPQLKVVGFRPHVGLMRIKISVNNKESK